MRLALPLVALGETLFVDSGSAPLQRPYLDAQRSGRWYRLDSGVAYYARMDSPHPRTLRCATDVKAYLYTRSPAYHRWRVGLQGATNASLGVYGSRKTGDYSLALIVSGGAYAETEIDPLSVAYLDSAPNASLLMLNPTKGQSSELGDLRYWSVLPVGDLLVELAPVQSAYEVSVFTPLSDSSLVGRYLQSQSYQLRLLVPRTHPWLSFVAHARVSDVVELEYEGVYLPCSVQSVQSRPAGGVLWEIDLLLVATAPYAYRPERYVHVESYLGEHTVGYDLLGDAPAPVELRLLYPSAPPSNHVLEVYNHSTGDYVAVKPDAAGIWSLYDNGRIYHLPNPGTASVCNDRTDALVSGALPIVLEPKEGVLGLDHGATAYPSQVALAAYPRYLPEVVL